MAYPIEIVEEGMKDFESVSGGVKLVTVEGEASYDVFPACEVRSDRSLRRTLQEEDS
jgi:hypothetical protein